MCEVDFTLHSGDATCLLGLSQSVFTLYDIPARLAQGMVYDPIRVNEIQ